MRKLIALLVILPILSPLAISIATQPYKIMIASGQTMSIRFVELPIDLSGTYNVGDYSWMVISMRITDPVY